MSVDKMSVDELNGIWRLSRCWQSDQEDNLTNIVGSHARLTKKFAQARKDVICVYSETSFIGRRVDFTVILSHWICHSKGLSNTVSVQSGRA